MCSSKPSRVVVFVDGFNLYHFINARRDLRMFKWLDLSTFCKRFLPSNSQIVQIQYFTALPTWNQKKRNRHELYIKALESIGVKVIKGRFKKIPKSIKLNYRCELVYNTHEEKQTDVNIAVEMMLSAFREELDIAQLISGDTDFESIIDAYTRYFPNIKVQLVVPN